MRLKRLTELIAQVSSLLDPLSSVLVAETDTSRPAPCVSSSLVKIRPDIDLEDELGGPLVLDRADFSGRRPAIKPKSEPLAGFPIPPRHSSITSIDSLDASSSRPSPSPPSSIQGPSQLPPHPRMLPHISLSAERRQKGKDADEDDLARGFVKLARPDEVETKVRARLELLLLLRLNLILMLLLFSFYSRSKERFAIFSFLSLERTRLTRPFQQSSAIPLLFSAAGFKYGPTSMNCESIGPRPSSLATAF